MTQTTTIRFKGHGGDEISGFLARPDAPGGDPVPGIVLVQEVFGIDAHVREMCERFAGEGFVVFAPDLYAREGTPGPKPTAQIPAPVWSMDEVRAAVASLPDRRVLGDLEGALEQLASEQGVDKKRLAAVGFCMGGNYAYLLGCASRRVSAVVDFYGRFIYRELSANKPVQPLELALNLSCPMLALFGENDPSITAEDIEKFRKVMDQFARDVTIVTFPGVGHGFMNDRRRSYDREVAGKAWHLAVDFLHEQLA
ncbi:MAG TPA: dienelactone hydrolase family protein [Planctomycetota bacterium]|jgi:carboxymethylenebutenolidase|nr:dienelactone hydrolase family protein [Planctomycetota bacterium]